MVSTMQINRRLSRFVCAQAFWASLVIAPPLGILSAQADSSQHSEDNLEIIWIEVEAGNLIMGTGSTARQRFVDRFLISATEVTFGQYDAFSDATGKPKPDDNGWGRGTRPVLNVSYDDAVEFCHWLSKLVGNSVRLPNEVEWEYAAQGGSHSRGYVHCGGNDKDEVSWNEDNSGGQTHPVGTKKPNELGIFDMSGNLWEWCTDWSAPDRSGSQAASTAPGTEITRVLRGDSFDNPGTSNGYRLSVRLHKDSRHINIGFRIATSD